METPDDIPDDILVIENPHGGWDVRAESDNRSKRNCASLDEAEAYARQLASQRNGIYRVIPDDGTRQDTNLPANPGTPRGERSRDADS
jgi:hypothetical protein